MDTCEFDSHLSHLPAVQKTVQTLGLRSIREWRVVPGFIVISPEQTDRCTCAGKKTLRDHDGRTDLHECPVLSSFSDRVATHPE